MHYWSVKVAIPETAETLQDKLNMFRPAGYPGAVSTLDCFHLHWIRCPHELLGRHIGKEGIPTLVYCMACLPNLRIVACGSSAPGAINDKTMARRDMYVHKLRTDPLYTNKTYTLLTDEGEKEQRGVYSLVDAGFHRWRVLVSVLRGVEATWPKRWSKRAESVRKAAERVIAVLKTRFRILSISLDFASAEKIDNVVFACIILHNWLIEYDGVDRHGLAEYDWSEASDATIDDARASDFFTEHETRAIEIDIAATSPSRELRLGCQPPKHHVPELNDLNDLILDVDPDYVERQEALIKHYQLAFERKEIKWLKTRASVNL